MTARTASLVRVLLGVLVVTLRGLAFAQDADSLAQTIVKTAGLRSGTALCVHLGCGDGKLTGELAKQGPFLVHGLSRDQTKVEKAREHLQSQGLYGQASVEMNSLEKLPYADNLVNLVVIDDLPMFLKFGLSFKEIMRVVCPNGIAFLGKTAGKGGEPLSEESLRGKLAEAGIQKFEIVKQSGLWAKIKKHRPADMDEWTHQRYGADGNLLCFGN